MRGPWNTRAALRAWMARQLSRSVHPLVAPRLPAPPRSARGSDGDTHREAPPVEAPVAEHVGRAVGPAPGRPRRGGGVEHVVGSGAPQPPGQQILAVRERRGEQVEAPERPSAVRFVVVSGAPASTANTDSGWASTTAVVSSGSMAASTSAILASRLNAWMLMPRPVEGPTPAHRLGVVGRAEQGAGRCREHRGPTGPQAGPCQLVARPRPGVGQADRHVETHRHELAASHPIEHGSDVLDHLDRHERGRSPGGGDRHDPAHAAPVDPGHDRARGPALARQGTTAR